MTTEMVSETTCKARHDPVLAFMHDWNTRWNGILLWLITNLVVLVGVLVAVIWRTSIPMQVIPQVHADVTMTTKDIKWIENNQ